MAATDIAAAFAPDLLAPATVSDFNKQYEASEPYKHAVIPALINEDLLKATRHEIIEELRFAEKETDIYKVNQTGDLANLDGLPAEEAGKLQNLLRLRNAIYSQEFRDWLQGVTGCGPLSAKKKDMSINDYRQGCHLLNHDDVISTRRVSYILYLPDPDQPWQPEWGGALELYPVRSKGVPDDVPSKIIPPKWNQFTFFTVQPGHSFHSVEEVVHPSQSRLSISGWFHRPQEGEEGFTTEDEKKEAEVEKEMSSLESLSAKENAKLFEAYPEHFAPPLPGSSLSQEEKKFLIQFLNPAYLVEKTQEQLFEQFGDESQILLSEVLRKEIAQPLEKALRQADAQDGFQWWVSDNGEESTRIQSHGVGTNRASEQTTETKEWSIAGPPHKQRYAVLSDQAAPNKASEIATSQIPNPLPTDASALLKLLSTVLFPSDAFRHFLANISQLVPLGARPVEARRFRPGLDYTLARSDTDPVLDVTLNLTPDVVKPSLEEERKAGPRGLAGKAKKVKTAPGASSSTGTKLLSKKQAKDLAGKWESGDIGGWECYMAPHEGEEDPAVYQSGNSGKKATNGEEGDAEMKVVDGEEEEEEEIVEMIEDDGEEDEDFDGVLLNLTPSFNTLSVVLRDEGVMRFVKYLAASAGGSRWDVIGEFEIGAIEEEEEEMAEGAEA
ncbi:Oxoglutarate/iron-dependent oxygenase, C-terminal degradation domain protein [Kalmanozyma brasiliensis GHG001]|uniref:Oxoglutarate/iron-dependent oxygenase, C-terminal degradation domain protein n=1 Tax=Kalmanozyma brasiliensis (strain GHG001) TaxID=1365824 RepID=UPI002867D7A3|nr:Oxoglutarate/iron-dependent oxygenase, C-terminal degradation domain protein [Kalmanozyma brasiliensis GHG001]KAF6767153.1 Oxoglutarate/iron-dependent oxygenase, C-terminal degradation domain protein [Kalmanozyma brasiliensis GHG001]